ncbi:hypothetical protein HDZ31DRAFT_39301 [Schizophyllum fasciatum]
MYNIQPPLRRTRRHTYTRLSHDNLRLDAFPHIIPKSQAIPRKCSLDENTIRAPKRRSVAGDAGAPSEYDEATIKAKPECPPLASRTPVQPEAEDSTVRPKPSHPRGNIALFREVLDNVAREARAEERRLVAERLRAEELRRRRQAEEEARRKQAVLALRQYDAAWMAIGMGRVRPGSLAVAQFPWPVLHAVRSAEDIRADDVYSFLYEMQGLTGAQVKERLKQEILRWHPDKFNTKTIYYLRLSDRALVLEIAGRVARSLNELKARMDCSTP